MDLRTIALLSIVGLAGCYSPGLGSGSQQCSADKKCPDGYFCFNDNHCYKNGATPGCSPACSGVTPRCDIATLKCVGCLTDKDCGAGTICDHTSRACVAGCNAQHVDCLPDAGACDVDAGHCRGCNGDGECTDANNPRCELASGRCQPCLPTNDNCKAGTFCVAAAGNFTCMMGCKVNADCKGDTPDGGPGMARPTCCDHRCFDLNDSDASCGICGKACPVNQHCCSASCADYTIDVSNCGSCGHVCKPLNVTVASCSKGACGYTACADGFGDCDSDTSNGCERSITDVNNCGACNMVCPAMAHATAGCTNGACVVQACDPGFLDCNGQVADGCEVDGTTDVGNCGACGKACAAPANSTASCAAGKCGYVCKAPFLDCDMMAPNGCEVNSTNDVKNCGRCGAACSLANAAAACANSACAISQCAPGFGNCNMMVKDGCEANLLADNKNCGKCGLACADPQVCTKSGCFYQPNGVQMNVPVGALAGWTLCYSDTYNVNMQAQVPAIQKACNQAKLLLACRPNNAATITLLAWGLASDVMFDTGAAANQGHTVGSVVWYFDPNFSWGFATAGDVLSLGQCDVNAGADRLCWHTINAAGGYRCGDATGLNSDATWDRLIYQAP